MDEQSFSDLKEEIREKNNIVDVVSSYLDLKRAGSDYKALCPFHNEKTPSFTVRESTQSFHCFGCGARGDVFQFVMQMEHLSFSDALILLGRRAGIDVEARMAEARGGRSQEKQARGRQMEAAMLDAARFFYHQYKGADGEKARQYMEKTRALPRDILLRFGIGYGGEAWDGLYRFLHAKGYADQLLLDAGLVRRQRHGFIDLFHQRVIFPVFDVRGKLIAFGGRSLSDNGPKYINSPDTPIFRKGKNLYALNFVRRQSYPYLILTEGYMDTIALHAHGFPYAVAGLGTALTADQARLLLRYTGDRLLLSYDMDGAGQKASLKTIELLRRELHDREEGNRIQLKILTLPDGKDPDEYLRKQGGDAFRHQLGQAWDVLAYKLELARRDSRSETGEVDLDRYQSLAVRSLSEEENSILRERYAQNFAASIGLSPASVQQEIEKEIARREKLAERPRSRSLPRRELRGREGQRTGPEMPQLSLVSVPQEAGDPVAAEPASLSSAREAQRNRPESSQLIPPELILALALWKAPELFREAPYHFSMAEMPNSAQGYLQAVRELGQGEHPLLLQDFLSIGRRFSGDARAGDGRFILGMEKLLTNRLPEILPRVLEELRLRQLREEIRQLSDKSMQSKDAEQRRQLLEQIEELQKQWKERKEAKHE